MLLLIVPLKVGASCTDDKQKELTDRLRCLYGLRSGGFRIALYLDVKDPGVDVIELVDGSD